LSCAGADFVMTPGAAEGGAPVSAGSWLGPRVTFACLVLVGLAGAWTRSVVLAERSALLAAPAGSPISVYREAIIAGVLSGGRVRVWERAFGSGGWFVVEGSGIAGDVDDTVTVVGRFEPPDRILAGDVRVHRGRSRKVHVSLPVIAGVLALLVARLRVTRVGLAER
jgi:hypothetical protein